MLLGEPISRRRLYLYLSKFILILELCFVQIVIPCNFTSKLKPNMVR